MNKEDVKHLSKLARIELSETEVENFTKEIADILSYVSVVQDIAGDDNSDTNLKVGARYNIFRADVITNEPDSYTETLLVEMPNREGRYMKVKKILSTDTE